MTAKIEKLPGMQAKLTKLLQVSFLSSAVSSKFVIENI